MCNMSINAALNGVELSFDGKPESNVLSALKENGFRWHNTKKIWYARQNEKTVSLAQRLSDNEAKEETTNILTTEAKTETTKTEKTKNINLPLWDRVQWDEFINNIDKAKSTGTKEIAKEIRQHVRSRFPECKFSVRSDYNSINFDIVASPYTYNLPTNNDDMSAGEYNKQLKDNNKELIAIKDYCSELLKSYKYCTCYDPYGDYGSSYNFFGHGCDIYYKYEQIEQTEDIIKDIEAFRAKLEEHKKAEHEAFLKHCDEQAEQRKKEAEEAKIRQIKEAEEQDKINNNILYTDLEENKQYYITGCMFAKCNKMQRMSEYRAQIEDLEYYDNDIKITREVFFNDDDILNLYAENYLLRDFDFITSTGGSFTEDIRIQSMQDYQKMSREEQQTVKFILTGIAVYSNKKELQFVIDAQGYNYARYVGLTDNAEVKKEYFWNTDITVEETEENKQRRIIAAYIEDVSTEIITQNNMIETWQKEDKERYFELLENKITEVNYTLSRDIIQQIDGELEELKTALYEMLFKMNSVQKLFSKANFKDGDKITIFSIGDMGMVQENRATFHNVSNTKYAQYNDAVKIVFTPKNKRKQYYQYIHSNKNFIVYRGWIECPQTVLYNVEARNGMIMSSSKYGSCDIKQLDEIQNYFEAEGTKPIINHKRES